MIATSQTHDLSNGADVDMQGTAVEAIDGPALEALQDTAARRLRILISAYSCAPGSGSENGIGWNTSRTAAERHEVWVLTRSDHGFGRNHRDLIEAELKRNPQPYLHVLYCDLPGWLRHVIGVQAVAYLWQLKAYLTARRAHRTIGFDLAHHISWVRWYTPSLLHLLPVPFIWGPIGGGERLPRTFLRGISGKGLYEEAKRGLLNAFAPFDPLVRLAAQRSILVIANSNETHRRLVSLGATRIRIFGESGIDDWILDLGEDVGTAPEGPVRFVSLNRLLHWKGVHLGLEAFARLGRHDAIYTIVGEGPEKSFLEKRAKGLGIADRVEFLSNLSRVEWMTTLRQADALVHACTYNSGNAISLEAMALAKPVICLQRGGILGQVNEETGYCMPASSSEEAVAGLRDAMAAVAADREAAAAKGRRGRLRVQQHFTWAARSARFDRFYHEALDLHHRQRTKQPASQPKDTSPLADSDA
ncbi:glycosyltransferase [Boseaceae bacterium BT-24-1]|nr:glycosyltransferase [Boseaceae bacterium BT-24-1]